MNKNNKIDDSSALGYFWGFFFCFWLENLIKVGGIFKMTLKVLLSILCILFLVKMLIEGMKIYKGVIDKIILIIASSLFLILSCGYFCVYSKALFFYDRTEIITENYKFYKDVHHSDPGIGRDRYNVYYYLCMNDNDQYCATGKEFKINSSLYGKFKDGNGKIRVVYWDEIDFISSIEYVD